MNMFDKILGESLDDLHLSRNEQRAIRNRIQAMDLSASDRLSMRHQAFQKAREYTAKEGHDPTVVMDWLDDVTRALMATDDSAATYAKAYFSPSDEPRNALIGLLRATKRQLDICVFTITDNDISSEIRDAHDRGVRVCIITDNHKAEDRGSDIDRLAESGIQVLEDQTDKHMHHKFALFDNTTLLTGSYNWTRSAAEFNQENMLVTDDPRLVRPFVDEFARLVKEFS